MPSYRITKYNPSFRDSNGSYTRDDWTSVGDVGGVFGGRVLTWEDYQQAEDAYVETVRRIMTAAGVEELTVRNLERYAPTNDVADRLGNNTVVRGDELARVIRGCLREHMWCRLSGKNGFFVHFGQDYYMHVGFDGSAALPELPPGMFAESCESPLMDLDG
jgi:hypothetical protein